MPVDTTKPLSVNDFTESLKPLIAKHAEKPDEFRGEPIYIMIRGILDQFDSAMYDFGGDKNAEKRTEAFSLLFGKNALYTNGGLFDVLETISLERDDLVLTGKRKVAAKVSGRDVNVTADQVIRVNKLFLATIFNEMEWFDVSAFPTKDYIGENPDHRDRFFGKDPFYDRPMLSMVPPPFRPYFREDDRNLLDFIEQGRVMLTPVGDGRFRLEIEGLKDERAEKEAARVKYAKRSRFADRFDVRDSTTVKEKIAEILKHVGLTPAA